VATQKSGATLINVGRALSYSGTELDAENSESLIEEVTTETGATRDQEETGHVQSGLRLRLRASQPRITLRLRFQATSQTGEGRRKGPRRETVKKGNNRKNKKGPKGRKKGKTGKS
jgi:hypothetical protein